MDVEWEELDLLGQGSLYRFIPLKMFTALMHLNLSFTTISDCHAFTLLSRIEAATNILISLQLSDSNIYLAIPSLLYKNYVCP